MGAAVEEATPEAAEDPAEADAADDAPVAADDDAAAVPVAVAASDAGAAEDRSVSVGADPGADEDWLDEQPTTATAAKTAQAAAILTLV
ncbi:MAG TPA: hypothetical protein VHZ33_21375 [Trebonia sp.]|nr:hypothetical protein [Trebonia sp.]